MISFTTEDVSQCRLLGDLIGWPLTGTTGHVDVFKVAGGDSFASLQGSASKIIMDFLWGLARIVWVLVLHEVLFDVRETSSHSLRFVPLLNLIEIVTDGLPPLLVTIIFIEKASKPLINSAFDMVFKLNF